MEHFTPPKGFTDKCQGQLNAIFRKNFETSQVIRKERAEARETVTRLNAKLLENEEEAKRILERSNRKNFDKAPVVGEPPTKHSAIPEFHVLDTSVIVFSPPFPLSWTWNATNGVGFQSMSANPANGAMEFVVTGGSGGSSVAVALGGTFRPKKSSSYLHAYANPSIWYQYECHAWLTNGHTHAFMGFYIAEYTLAGDFVAAVVDQRISLWDLSSDDTFIGSSSGFPLSASLPVNNNNFYAVWVWAAADAEAGSFLNAYSRSTLKVVVPAISMFIYG